MLSVRGKGDEAHKEYEKARDLLKRLVGTFPAVTDYQFRLGGTYVNVGDLARRDRKSADSVPWYEEAMRTLTPVLHYEPRDVEAKFFLRTSYQGRALACHQLGKHADAVKDWDKAVNLSPKVDQPERRAHRAHACLMAGLITEAVTEVAELTTSDSWDQEYWSCVAGLYAIASRLDVDKKQAYADRAMHLRNRAVKAGFTHAAHIARDKALDPLRDRDDFKKLMASLPKPAEKEKTPPKE